ncbi:hypothetical protein V8F06_013801 [Rhypophila decipiens]
MHLLRFFGAVASLGWVRAQVNEILIYGCLDEDCNDCMNTWSDVLRGNDKISACIDTFSAFYKSAKLEAVSEGDGDAIIGMWSDEGTTGACGLKDPSTGCSSVQVHYSQGPSCLTFMHPNGEWPPQMHITYGLHCWP